MLRKVLTLRSVNTDNTNESRESVLHFAAQIDSKECRKLLIQRGASISKRSVAFTLCRQGLVSRVHRTAPQSWITFRGENGKKRDVISFSRCRGQRCALKILLKQFGESALHLNGQDGSGSTPVLIAVKAASGAALRFLFPFSNISLLVTASCRSIHASFPQHRFTRHFPRSRGLLTYLVNLTPGGNCDLETLITWLLMKSRSLRMIWRLSRSRNCFQLGKRPAEKERGFYYWQRFETMLKSSILYI